MTVGCLLVILSKQNFFLSVAISKCDLVDKGDNTIRQLEEEIRQLMIEKNFGKKYKILYDA
jgi:translation elongation factor EF-Tu-like GTPase